MNKIVQLPEPQRDLDFPLMNALLQRRTKRKWLQENLSLQEISNLLWCACGINQEATKKSKSKRTSPSATNSQIISLYITLDSGLYKYDENNHQLIVIFERDIREYLGTQKMMKSAPLGIIFVSDYSKMKTYMKGDQNKQWFVSGTECGCISQNIYLYCAAANLNTALLGLVNREQLHNAMELQEHEKVVYTQAVGKSLLI